MAGEKYFDLRFYNIVMLGLSFMFIFTAFQTTGMVEKTVLDGAKNETNGTFKGDGYTSLSIIYVVFSVSNWVAPSAITVIGPRAAMFSGSILYLLLIGNGYSHFVLRGADEISKNERTLLFLALSGAGLLGCLLLLLLRKRRTSDGDNLVNLNSSGQAAADTPLQALKRSFHLLKTKEMLMLSVAIAYTGVELTFFSGVYGTCISNNKHFGSKAKGLIGISGMFIGVGEILGGTVFGLLGKRTNRHGRDLIVIFGYLVHMVAFYLIYINFPSNSPIKESLEDTYITSNVSLAILCSFLLGLGDSSFNTQIYALLGFMFPEDSSPAFAIFKFVQSIATAAGFYYSEYLLLQYQLLIMVILGSLGSISFAVVEWQVTNSNRDGYQSI